MPVTNAEGELRGHTAVPDEAAERSIRFEAEKFLAAVLADSADGVWTCTTDGTILTWNRSAEEIWGYTAQEVVGRHISMLVPPVRRIPMERLHARTALGERVSSFEGICLTKDGRQIPLSVTTTPLRNPAGEVVAVLSTIRDISERRESQRIQALLASVVQSSESAIFTTGLDGCISSWNQSAVELFGYPAEEISGKRAGILIPGDTVGDSPSWLETVPQKQTGRFETLLRAKNGRTVYVSLCISPLRNSAGESIGAAVTATDIGNRLLAERKIQQGDLRFREIFDHSPFGMALAGLDRKFVRINESLCRMLGYSEPELLELNWSDVTHPEDVELLQHRANELFRHPEQWIEAEKRYIHHNGDILWGRLRMSMLPDYRGQPEFFVIQIEDITARKRAESALEESEQRFRIMADGCPALLSLRNASSEIEFINKAFLEFFGTVSRQPSEATWISLLHPEDAKRYVQELRRSLEEKTGFRTEARFRRADGEFRWLSVQGDPRFSGSGVFLGHVVLGLDITDRKQAEQAIRSSEEKFRQLAENIREVFWIVALPPCDGARACANSLEVIYVSPAFEQVWERSCQSLYENPQIWGAAIHPDDREKSDAVFLRQQKGEIEVNEYRIQTPDGKEKWVRNHAFPVHDDAGRIIRLVGVAEDVTDQKRYEAELVEARKGAEAANQAKSRFLTNMSHEIRTPMNGVLGMGQLLLATNLTPEQRQFATIAQSSAESLMKLIDGILDFARIEERKVELESASFQPRELVESVVELLSGQASAAGLHLRSHVSPEIPGSLRGDPHRIRQILINLCGNALKFTHKGGVELHLTPDRSGTGHAEGKARLRFTVHDTGIGIPPGKLASLFAPFTQVDASTTRKYGGAGMGLAISKQLAELMGGTIGAESEEGRGSTFWFTADLEVHGPATTPLPGQPRQGTRKARILIADDNATNRETTVGQLRWFGHDCVAVPDGFQAIEAARSSRFDVVLMDCQMPLMDGFEATRGIRALCPETPVLALTADVSPGFRERCLAEGMSDYLAKPLDLLKLEQALAQYLDPESLSPAPGATRGGYGELSGDCHPARSGRASPPG